MDIIFKRKIVSILKVLSDAQKHRGGTRVARRLKEFGFDLNQRMGRN